MFIEVFHHGCNNQVDRIVIHIRAGQMIPTEIIILNIKDFLACSPPVVLLDNFLFGRFMVVSKYAAVNKIISGKQIPLPIGILFKRDN